MKTDPENQTGAESPEEESKQKIPSRADLVRQKLNFMEETGSTNE